MKEQLVQSENELGLGDLYKKAKQLIDNARDSIELSNRELDNYRLTMINGRFV